MPEWQTGPEAEVLGRFEPSAYDLGITDDPEPENEPVPYSLTPQAEAALEGPPALSRYPGINDPERLAEWCGFPSAADMCAAYEEYARDLEARGAAEAEEEAELDAAYAAEWAGNRDSGDSAAYAARAEEGLEPKAEL